MANEFKVRKGLVVNGSGSVILDIQGSQGQLFSVTDSLTGSLFSVNDISGMPILAVSSDDSVRLGTFNREAIRVSGSSATITGSFTGSFTGNLTGTASWANNATSASITANAVTASYVLNAVSSSFAATASSADNFNVRGTLTATTIVVQTITSSTDFVTGSTRFGSSLANTHQFTGSVSITGSLTSPNITGSLQGTASWADNATTASYVLNAASASYALSASYAQTASYALDAVSASFATSAANATTASYILNAASASYALTASFAATASFVPTSSLIGNFFAQGGNSFGAQAILGTNDSQSLAIRTNGSTRITVDSTGSVGIATTSPGAFALDVNGTARVQGNLTVTGSITAASAIARGANFTSTLVASANSDVLVGLDINPTFNIGAFSGTNRIGLRVQDNRVVLTGTYTQNINENLNPETLFLINTQINGRSNQAIQAVRIVPTIDGGTSGAQVHSGLFVNPTFTNIGSATTYSINSPGNNIFGASGFATTLAGANVNFSGQGGAATNLNVTTPNNQGFRIKVNSTAAQLNFEVDGSGNSDVRFVTANTEKLRIFNNGNVTIQNGGTHIDAGFRLDVNGSTRFNGNSIITGSLTVITGSAIEFQVTNTGVRIGNAIADVHTVTGSLSVSGSVTATNFTGSLLGTAATASYVLQAVSASFATQAANATTASYVLNAVSASFATSAATATTASYILNAASASYALSSSYALNASTATSASFATNAATAASSSFATNAATATSASYATFANTASSADNFNVRGTLTATTLVVQTITSSTDFVTGSTRFGSLLSNTHQFTGSMSVTGSLTVSGVATLNNLTGSLFGTASWASNAVTASIADNAVTASRALNANTASYVLNAVSASFATSAANATTASYVLNAVSASFASTASFVNTLNQSVIVTSYLAVGTSSLGATENTLVVGPSPAGGAGEGGQILLQAKGDSGYTSASMLDVWQNQFRILRGTNASSDGLVAQWNLHSKQVQFPAYTGSGAFTGTATANLAVDSAGNILTVATGGGASAFPFTGSAQITGSLGVTGSISASGAFVSLANGAMYFRGGDDAELWDINVANTLGVYGQQNQDRAGIKLGSAGPTLFGSGSNLGIGMTTPSGSTLTVNGNVWATSFTGSLLGTATTASYVQNAASASYALSSSYALNASTAASASFTTNAISASYAQFANTASSADNFNVRGTLTATTLVVQTITSSQSFITGSTRFGSSLANTHQFTGSVTMNPGGLFVSSSGLVGIGTTAPLASLQIGNPTSNTSNRSSVAMLSAATSSAVLDALSLINSATAANGNGTALNFHNANNYSPTVRIEAVQDAGTSASLRFYTYEGSLTEKMRINSSGSVGIGTTAPSASLDVTAGGVVVRGGGSTAPTQLNGLHFSFASNVGYIQSIQVGSTGRQLEISGFPLIFKNSNTGLDIMRLATNNNVGIGTTSPNARLDVSGSGNFSGNLTVTGSLTVITGSAIEFQVTNTGVRIGNAITDIHTVTGSLSISG
jgi:hypothetical protein